MAANAGNHAGAIRHYARALELQPNAIDLVVRLARLLATCPDARLRDGARAVALAEHAAALSNQRDAWALDTLAVAYAAAGRFTAAESSAERAQQRASLDDQAELAIAIETRRELYARGEAFVEKSPSSIIATGKLHSDTRDAEAASTRTPQTRE